MANEKKAVDWVARIVAVLSFLVSLGGLWINHSNAVAASEQVLIAISPSPTGLSVDELSTHHPANGYHFDKWDVAISNSSLSAKTTISAIEVGPISFLLSADGQFLETQSGERLIALVNELENVPNLPISLGPSDPLKFTMITYTMNGRKTAGTVTIHTTRGGSYTGSVRP